MRLYDPEVGRFLSPDPLNPQLSSRYSRSPLSI